MFEKYYLIYYDDIMPTLQQIGITKEYYDTIKQEKKLYPETMQLLTYCKKNEIINLAKIIIKNSEYPESVKVIKVPKCALIEVKKYYIPYCVIKSKLECKE